MLEYELVNIITNPIFVFAVFKLFRAFLGDEVYNKKVEIISYFIYFLLSSAIIFVTRIPLVMLIFTVLSFFLISLNYKSKLYKKIITTVFIYSILFVIEIIVSVAVGFLDISAISNSTFNSIIGIILIRTVTIIVAYVISKLKNARRKDFTLPKLYYVALTVILFGTIFLFAASLESDNLTIYNVVFSGAVLITVNITMMSIDEKIYNSIIAINEKNILKQQNIAYENQAEIINQSTETIRALKHDMKNHLMMLDEMYANDKKNEIDPYIKEIMAQMDSGAFSQSNNFVIDSIVNFKLGKLKDKDVDIKVNINVPQVLNILAYDLTVILGNLLDNAITAVEQSKEKRLVLRISCNKGNLIILLDNSFNGNLIVENGKFKTTKEFKVDHGIGLTNVEKVLENYKGEIQIKHTEDAFSVSVIIPYEE